MRTAAVPAATARAWSAIVGRVRVCAGASVPHSALVNGCGGAIDESGWVVGAGCRVPV
eukprot:COSAG02_NODE_360_length_23829_cov_107.112769_2_plen_58_part_00